MSPVEQRTRRKKCYPHGIAIEPSQIKDDVILQMPSPTLDNMTNHSSDNNLSDLFVTMCFFARLGFVQPPSCLKCAYHSSGCAGNHKNTNNVQFNDSKTKMNFSNGDEEIMKHSSMKLTHTSQRPCGELVAWRVNANLSLHPDDLDGNIVFITCDTAKSLVNGDAYPSIRWDIRNKRLLHEKISLDVE